MRTQKDFSLMNTDLLLEKWETWYAAIKTKDMVKLFSDVCLFNFQFMEHLKLIRFFNLETNAQFRVFVN